jgi:ketosteroid isomerase-like protein
VGQSNSELLLAGYEAWNHDDLDGYLELLHPDVRISTSGLFPGLAAEYVGRDRAATFWSQMQEPWERFRIDVEHIEDEGEWAVASLRLRARGRDSGVDVDMRFGMAMKASEGLGIEFLNRSTFDDARTAMSEAQPAADRSRT